MNGPASSTHKNMPSYESKTHCIIIFRSVVFLIGLRTSRRAMEAVKIEISRRTVVSAEHVHAFYSPPNLFSSHPRSYFSIDCPSIATKDPMETVVVLLALFCAISMSPGTFACEASSGKFEGKSEGKSEGTFYSHVETTRVAPVSGQHCVKSNIYTRSAGLWINLLLFIPK